MVKRRAIKRARPSSASEPDEPAIPPVSDEQILKHLQVLDSQALRGLLLDAARNHPETLEAIEAQAAPLAEEAASYGVRLQDYASHVYYMLHYFGDDPQIPGKYHVGKENYVRATIDKQIDMIDERCPDDAKFGTKRNALVDLRRICEHIYTANTPVGEKIRSGYTGQNSKSTLEIIILRIVRGMTREERHLLSVHCWDENWLYETASLADETAREGLFCRLVDVVRLVGGPGYDVRDQGTMRKNQTLAWLSRMRIGKELRRIGDRMSGAPDVENQPVPEWAT